MVVTATSNTQEANEGIGQEEELTKELEMKNEEMLKKKKAQ